MPSYWLIVERYDNWRVDRANNFCHFGVADRKKATAMKIKPGDLLVGYVSGKSCFSDLRKVLSPPIIRLRLGGPYDAPFSIALSTEPLIIPPEENWIPVKELAARLSFLNATDWRQSFRSSLRPIPEADGRLLEWALKNAARGASIAK
jgi:hypothetical protein